MFDAIFANLTSDMTPTVDTTCGGDFTSDSECLPGDGKTL